jgi:hypothetical protein
MKHASNPRRGRGRNSGKRNQNSRNRNFESGGSESKVRGTAQQVLDKYLALARDASAAGDRIAAEGYFQHAEHYHRILNPEGGQGGNQNDRKPRHQEGGGRRDESQTKSDNQPQANEQAETTNQSVEPEVAAVEASPEPVIETPETPVAEPEAAAEVVQEKPKRRGRPRKAAPVEATSKDDNASETAA